MMRGRRFQAASLAIVGVVPLAGGCDGTLLSGFLVDGDVDPPPVVQTVLDDLTRFKAGDAELTANQPGTVIDDLATLDGCWATVFVDSSKPFNISLFEVYEFDAAANTFQRWSGLSNSAGELWPLVPVISLETGTYEVTGPAAIVLTDEHILSNYNDSTGKVTSEFYEDEGFEPLDRPTLATLDGDQMMFFIDAESAADIDEAFRHSVHHQFDCP